MQQRYLFLFLLLGASLFAGCRPSSDEETEITVRLDPEFRVDLYEQRDPADGRPVFGLWLESLAPYACPDFRLDALLLQGGGDTLRVLLNGVMAPDTCAGDSAVLQDFIPVGPLADGVYTLDLRLGQAIGNSGALRVENGLFEWQLPVAAGIDLRNRVLRRIPEGILWGYVRTLSEQDAAPANALVAALKDLSTDHGLSAGYYGYFTITGTGLPFFHESASPAGNAIFFVSRYEEQDLPAIRDLLDGYRNDVPHPLTVVGWSTAGQL